MIKLRQAVPFVFCVFGLLILYDRTLNMGIINLMFT
jgi:hypothetical protein